MSKTTAVEWKVGDKAIFASNLKLYPVTITHVQKGVVRWNTENGLTGIAKEWRKGVWSWHNGDWRPQGTLHRLEEAPIVKNANVPDKPGLWWRKDALEYGLPVEVREYQVKGLASTLVWTAVNVNMSGVVEDDGQWLGPCPKPEVK